MAVDAEVEVGGGAETGGAPPPETRIPLNETPADGPGSGRSVLRKQLETNVEKVRKTEEREQRPIPKQRSRARQELESQEQAPPAGQEAEGEQETPVEGAETKAPEGWAKEAKAAWEQLPPEVQAAVTKREVDMAKGVDEIKKKYSEIDQALAPRMNLIRGHGHTPAQAVNQLFAWFEALSGNPAVAFPALAQSFKYDLRSIPGLMPTQEQLLQWARQQQQPAAQGQQPGQQHAATNPEEIPIGVQNYVRTLEQKLNDLQQGVTQQLGQLSSSFQQQSQAKTEEILANWSKDKPYFEDVRRMMAHLIQSQAVPPLPNGSADLDKAYDMALYALPDVRTKVLAEQAQKDAAARKAKAEAEKKLQQEQADKARKANGGSLAQTAPGNPLTPQGKAKKGKSVRDSIMEARQELSEQ